MKWIFVLMLLRLNPDTDEVEWYEAGRLPDLSFQTCIAMVVDTVVKSEGYAVDVWCEPDPEPEPQPEKKEDKYTYNATK